MGEVILKSGIGSLIDSSDLTASASDVLDGYSYIGLDTNDEIGIGTMPNNKNVYVKLGLNELYTIPKGYHNGEGVIVLNLDIIDSIDNNIVITPGKSNQTFSNAYLNKNIIVKGDSNLVSTNIRPGISIFGVKGLDLKITTSNRYSNYFRIKNSSKINYLLYKDLTIELEIEYVRGNNKFKVVNTQDGVVACKFNNNKVILSGLTEGESKIIITQIENENYSEYSMELSVNVNSLSSINDIYYKGSWRTGWGLTPVILSSAALINPNNKNGLWYNAYNLGNQLRICNPYDLGVYTLNWSSIDMSVENGDYDNGVIPLSYLEVSFSRICSTLPSRFGNTSEFSSAYIKINDSSKSFYLPYDSTSKIVRIQLDNISQSITSLSIGLSTWYTGGDSNDAYACVGDMYIDRISVV